MSTRHRHSMGSDPSHTVSNDLIHGVQSHHQSATILFTSIFHRNNSFSPLQCSPQSAASTDSPTSSETRGKVVFSTTEKFSGDAHTGGHTTNKQGLRPAH